MLSTFKLGETKYVKIKLINPDGLPFVIDKSLYKLEDEKGVIVSEGDALIEENTLRMRLTPKEKGKHKLTITFWILDTIRITSLIVLVG